MTKISIPRPDEYSIQFENQASSAPVVADESIKDLDDGTQVIVKAKVHSTGEPYHTGARQLKVCDIVIGDITGVV